MGPSGYTPETERRIERLLSELYDALHIDKPDDLFGSIVIETRYQNGKPVGQVDVQIRYVMKRTAAVRSGVAVGESDNRTVVRGRRTRGG